MTWIWVGVIVFSLGLWGLAGLFLRPKVKRFRAELQRLRNALD